jgi:hypothetical protein
MTEPSLGKNKLKGKEYFDSFFSTKTSEEITKLRALWYPNETKIVPSNIKELLTPIALA